MVCRNLKSGRRIVARIAYDGSRFHGFQRQVGVETVQRAVETALSPFLPTGGTVVPSGRTDAGVHALSQIIHFDLDNPIPLERLSRALRKRLPPGIALLGAVEAPADFHARYSVVSKTYSYHLVFAESPSPFLEGYCWQIKGAIDELQVRWGMEILSGNHDFAGFCKLAHFTPGTDLYRDTDGKTRNTSRNLKVEFSIFAPGRWRFAFNSDGFLRYQVRYLVKSLVLLGSGCLTAESLADLLQRPRQGVLGEPAPPGGLYLERVHYHPELPFF